MNLYEGILLGLGTGPVCLAYCGPVLLPYLLGENQNISKNFFYVTLFLTGRLSAYIAIGLIAGFAGKMFLQPNNLTLLLTGISYVVLSVLLIYYGFYRFNQVCLGKTGIKIAHGDGRKMTYIVPLTGGALTGINLCPPFILAITEVAAAHNVTVSILFFIMFFIGTSLFFVPLPFLGFFKRQHVLRVVGKFAAILAGVTYLYKGVLMVFIS